MDISIRPETIKDYELIKAINDAAFGQENESRLVEELRKTALFKAELSLVAEVDNTVVGHILFYPVNIIDEEGNRYMTLCLGPMSVFPKWQRKGVGKKLMKESLLRAKIMRKNSVIVLGHPEYYPKFGFKKASEFNIKVPFDVPDEALMALELFPDAFTGVRGTVEYPEPYLNTV